MVNTAELNELLPDDPEGTIPTGAPPGLEDFFIHNDKGAPNIIREMTTTSLDPKEYMPRSIIDRNERAAILRMYARDKLWNDRELDITDVIWMHLALSIALDGIGREQAVNMYVGGAFRKENQGLGSGSMKRGKDANGNEIES